MRFFKLSNGEIINIETIVCITKPVKKDPYNKTYGLQYSIILTSGHIIEFIDSIENESVPLFGNSVLKYEDFMKLISDYVIE
jgi:hypothetical protein